MGCPHSTILPSTHPSINPSIQPSVYCGLGYISTLPTCGVRFIHSEFKVTRTQNRRKRNRDRCKKSGSRVTVHREYFPKGRGKDRRMAERSNPSGIITVPLLIADRSRFGGESINFAWGSDPLLHAYTIDTHVIIYSCTKKRNI